jgi:hypothetical protein
MAKIPSLNIQCFNKDMERAFQEISIHKMCVQVNEFECYGHFEDMILKH